MTETYTRLVEIDHTRADDASRTAPCVVSSEFAVQRGGYAEILSHAADAVDLSRAPLPLIEAHDNSRVNVGIVEGLRLVGRRLRGTVRLGNTERAKELWEDIKQGIVRNLSIGYEWLDFRDRGDDILVTRWMPFEVSLVAAGADPNAGLFRSNHPMADETETLDTPKNQNDIPDIVQRTSRGEKRRQSQFAREERERVSLVHRVFEHFFPNPSTEMREARDHFVERGTDIEDVRDFIRKQTPDPIATTPPAGYSELHGFRNSDPLPNQRASTGGNILRAFGETRREAEEAAFAAGQWLRGAVLGNHTALRWMQSRGMTISGSGGVGGHLVPAELSNAIISLMEEYGVARAECRIWPMGSDSLTIPRREGGLSAYFTGEASEIVESEGEWSNVFLGTRKLAVLTRMSSELAEDAVIDLASWIAEEIAYAFAEKEDACLFNGDGTSTYGGIVGLLTRVTTDGTAGVVTAATDHDTFAEIDASDLASLVAKLPKYARRGAKWYVSPTASQLVFGRLLMSMGGNAAADVAAINPTRFASYPIVESEHMPSDTGDLSGEPMIVFGNLRQAVALGDRRAIRVKVDESRYLSSDETAIQGTERFALVSHDVGDSTTAGPVVVLEGH